MLNKLPPRERQIVDLLYVKGESTVASICEELPVALTPSAVRAMLTRLEAKGFVARRQSESGILYSPTVPQTKARESALSQIVKTFFNGSPAGAASALLGMSDKLGDEELDELERMIAEARKSRSE
ncbi:MAG TPA: BlaI/MecI/CopY family transcriptional regulator [Allosphingosinicella sp.]|nr:BlaI/MecI/CopY family transcriptional regulator [Allosphingosinicella sp.]